MVDRRVSDLGALLARNGGPALLRRLTAGASEAQIERRFSPADGFRGRVRYELARPATGATALVWTIEVEARHASAHRGATAPAELIVRFTLADFIAIAAGVIDPAEPLLSDRASFVGDLGLAARLPEMFGAPAPATR